MIHKTEDTVYIQLDKNTVYNQRLFQRTTTESELSDQERVILKLVDRVEELEK